MADRLYCSNRPEPGRLAKYQERQERLKEIRSQINMLSHDTIQSLEPPPAKTSGTTNPPGKWATPRGSPDFDALSSQLLQNNVRSRRASRRTCGSASRYSGSVLIEVKYAIFFRAEPANTGLVEDDRSKTHAVGHARGGRGHNDADGVHGVTALPPLMSCSTTRRQASKQPC